MDVGVRLNVLKNNEKDLLKYTDEIYIEMVEGTFWHIDSDGDQCALSLNYTVSNT